MSDGSFAVEQGEDDLHTQRLKRKSAADNREAFLNAAAVAVLPALLTRALAFMAEDVAIDHAADLACVAALALREARVNQSAALDAGRAEWRRGGHWSKETP